MFYSKAFFDTVREQAGPLSQQMVDGCNYLIGEGLKRQVPVMQCAYVLATAWHETARTMTPIAEYGKGEGYPYGEPTQYGGQVAYGRGYVQLTWVDNYEKADSILALDGALLADFDLALDPPTAAQIIFQGMEEGWFTGVCLDDYITKTVADYLHARQIVNGMDCAEQIKGYAEVAELGLRRGYYHRELRG